VQTNPHLFHFTLTDRVTGLEISLAFLRTDTSILATSRISRLSVGWVLIIVVSSPDMVI
jgi:hypothetical protein